MAYDCQYLMMTNVNNSKVLMRLQSDTELHMNVNKNQWTHATKHDVNRPSLLWASHITKSYRHIIQKNT